MAFSDRPRRALAFAFGPEGVAVATELETAVETVAPGELTLANAHILVGNAAGIGADVAMSGDVTIDNTGATTIGAKKVTAAKIALANGKILVGDAAGAAAEQTASGDATIAASGAIALAATAVAQATKAVIKTDAGALDVLAAAARARRVIIVVTVNETFADGGGTQTTVSIGEESGAADKFAATAKFTGQSAGATFAFAGNLSSGKKLQATAVAATGAGTGGVTIDVIAVGI